MRDSAPSPANHWPDGINYNVFEDSNVNTDIKRAAGHSSEWEPWETWENQAEKSLELTFLILSSES